MKLEFSINELEAVIQPLSVEGATEVKISSIASIDQAKEGDLAFLSNPKYASKVASSEASLILVPEGFDGKPNAGQVYFRVKDPSMTLAKICSVLEEKLFARPKAGVHPSAVVDPSAQVDESATVGPLCVVGAGSIIGKDVVLCANVYIGAQCVVGDGTYLMAQVRVMDYCEIGKRVRIHSGTVIGSDGFGYYFDKGVHNKIPQIGKVVIDDFVEIGANTTIDRARFSETRIGEGTKIDNLVQIAHNVVVGKHCIILSQAGIAGSCTLEDYAVIGGQVGVADHIKIGSGARIGSQSGINHDLKPGERVRGSPAYSYMHAQRVEVLQRRLPDFFKRLKHVEEELALLKVES